MKALYFCIVILLLIHLMACRHNSCDSTVCFNNGICLDGLCHCPTGYSGIYCEWQDPIDTSNNVIAGCDSTIVVESSLVRPELITLIDTTKGSINLTIAASCCDTLVGNEIPDYTYIWQGPSGFTTYSQDIEGINYGWYSCLIICQTDSLEGWYWVARQVEG